MKEIAQLTLTNDISQVALLEGFMEQVGEAAGLDMSMQLSLNLAVEEAVSNVIMYAYPDGSKGTADISARLADGQLSFVLSDSGVAFDPTRRAEVDTTLSAEERPIGGLGIHLVRQIMDSVSYERTSDGRNVLTMTKKLST